MTSKPTTKQVNSLRKTLEPLTKDRVKLPDGYITQDHDHRPGVATTTRTAIHRGKKIEIETTYKILIDGEPLGAHVSVHDDGRVRYHGLPNYSFSSAIDLARQAIEAFSDPLPDDELNRADDQAKAGS